MSTPRATVCYEVHKGAQRFAQFAHRCGWVSEWFPVKTKTRTIPCAKCCPERKKTPTPAERDLLDWYNLN